MTSKDLTGRLHRWALQLQEYNFTVVYRPGAGNVVADALSRAPVNSVTAARGDQQNLEEHGGEGQLTDAEIKSEQAHDKTVKRLLEKGSYGASVIEESQGLVCIRDERGGRRVVLPSTLWAKALKEHHDSIFACHLRTPQTYARIATVYWWPDMRAHVKRWVQACRDCGSRKSKPKEVVPPLRSQDVGDVGDRWALDVAGPLPLTADGNRYVIAAVDYASRYVVTAAVPTHTATDIAQFIVGKLVMVYGPMRELVMDGAPELNGRVIEELVNLLQARQMTPVPYRPALLGLVERFHRTWKDMVSLYVAEAQNDWDRWLPCAAYAYNGARHTGTQLTPNELMMGRKLRAPNELLRATRVTQTGPAAKYHQALVSSMSKASAAAKAALAKEQRRRESYYDRRARTNMEFASGDLVWVLKPPKGRGITKLAHQWVGPARVASSAGFDNWSVVREDNDEQMIVHSRFMVSCRCPSDSLGSVADRILRELASEDAAAEDAESRDGEVRHGHDEASENTADIEQLEGTSGQAKVRSSGSEQQAASRPGTEEIGPEGNGSRGAARPGIAGRDARAAGEAPRSRQPAKGAQRKRKQQEGAQARDDDAHKQQRRREADAAREARATRRQATRSGEEVAADATQVDVATLDGLSAHAGLSSLQQRVESGGGHRDSQGRERDDASTSGGTNQDTRCGEPRGTGVAVEMVRGRGRPRRPEPTPVLLQVVTAGHIVERARRRVRNRAGRYVLEHEVEYSERPGMHVERRWLTAEKFEELLDAGKVEDDLAAGDDV
ncbi:hypothetical protein PF008_g26010 [Phytophthora fragariae]|uniref:Integrase catalytic domain-containing protein n=1 Tax=Phytophthora fragariae TaxID=53985 RepID=A0A6G0QIF0_9STRA|nr:hypothetical protein PF008_g26010 [Phytophthora fragariae]